MMEKKVVKIQGPTYSRNPYIKAIRIGKNLKVLEQGLFSENGVLEIFVSEGLEVVGDGAFVKTDALRYVSLNEGLKSIGNASFAGTGAGLKELIIPKSVKEISPGAFLNSNNLVIKSYPGSPAKEIAAASGIKYEEIKE